MEDSYYENLSRLVTSPDLLSHLQSLKLDGGEKNVSFQWLGPHFLTFLKYAEECLDRYEVGQLRKDDLRSTHDMRDMRDLLNRLDYSAYDYIFYGEILSYFDNEHYKNILENILETILTVMPELNEFFTIQGPISNNSIVSINWENFIYFLFECIRELLSCRNDSTVLVSSQVKFLQKGLNCLLTFLVYPIPSDDEQKKSIFTEIEAVFNEAGLFLHSFFFTTDLVTSAEMDRAIFVLLERIEIVLVKIKYYSIAVSSEVGIGSLKVAESPSEVGIGRLQVAESPSEVSSSQDPTVEIVVGLEDTTELIVRKLVGESCWNKLFIVNIVRSIMLDHQEYVIECGSVPESDMVIVMNNSCDFSLPDQHVVPLFLSGDGIQNRMNTERVIRGP